MSLCLSHFYHLLLGAHGDQQFILFCLFTIVVLPDKKGTVGAFANMFPQPGRTGKLNSIEDSSTELTLISNIARGPYLGWTLDWRARPGKRFDHSILFLYHTRIFLSSLISKEEAGALHDPSARRSASERLLPVYLHVCGSILLCRYAFARRFVCACVCPCVVYVTVTPCLPPTSRTPLPRPFSCTEFLFWTIKLCRLSCVLDELFPVALGRDRVCFSDAVVECAVDLSLLFP